MAQPHPTIPGPRRGLAVSLLLASGAVHAVVGAPGASDQGGALADIPYGSSGNVYQLQPLLFVGGLGVPDDPLAVAGLASALSFGYQIGGAGTSLLQLRYTVSNTSAVESFSDLRFMAFLNPDGEQDPYLDRASESWGAATAGGPSRREWQAFSFDPLDSIPARFRVTASLVDAGPGGDCAQAAGCDVTAALQWDAPQLGPMQRWAITLGLSDDAQALSSRWIAASAVGSADTVLTISGTAVVSAVPDAPGWAMLACGLPLLVAWARRRRAR